jgi:hypothetical protein
MPRLCRRAINRRPKTRTTRLLLLSLEDRIAPATFTVTNFGDTGAGSGSSGDLRYCINQSNALGGTNSIVYAAGVSGTTLASSSTVLPTIADVLSIIGPTTLTFNGGQIVVGAAGTLSLSAVTWTGGYLAGPGTVATDPTNGATFSNMTFRASATLVSNSVMDHFNNVINSGTLQFPSNIGVPTPALMAGITNMGSGTIAIGANAQVNANSFQTSGLMTLAPGTTGSTVLRDTGGAPWTFSLGARTYISDVPHSAFQNSGIDLNGYDLALSQSLLVNNGFVEDATLGGAGIHKVISNTGSTVTGAGFFQNPVITSGTGLFEPGNGPGSAVFGSFRLSGPAGATGVSNFQWQINDAGPSATYPGATGQGGPTPNAAAQVSGWGMVYAKVTLYQPGSFAFDATPTDKLTIHLQAISPSNNVYGSPTVGGTYSTVSTAYTLSGAMAEFDSTQAYTWPVVSYQGTYTGPTDSATLTASTIFDTGPFAIPPPGTFSWKLVPNSDAAGGQLDLVYTPTAQSTAPPTAPANASAVANSPISITVSWDPSTGAQNYEVELANSPTGPWTRIYYGSAPSFTDDNNSYAHLGQHMTYYYRVAAANSAGYSPYSDTVSVTTPYNPTTTVSSITVNDGSGQRSEVRSISVNFSGSVMFAGGYANAAAAFQLTNVQTGNLVALSAAVSADHHVVTLSFSGSETDPLSTGGGLSASLADGVYSLTVLSSIARDHLFQPLDGDNDGVPGGDYVTAPDSAAGTGPHLYRLFGDVDGNGVVNAFDFSQFRLGFGSSSTDPGYLAYLDEDGNGVINAFDFAQFRLRYGTSLF